MFPNTAFVHLILLFPCSRNTINVVVATYAIIVLLPVPGKRNPVPYG